MFGLAPTTAQDAMPKMIVTWTRYPLLATLACLINSAACASDMMQSPLSFDA